MSNIRASDVFGSVFGRFGWFITAPVVIPLFIYQGIKTTLPAKLKEKFKDIQAKAVSDAQKRASASPGYYKTSGYSTREVSPANSESNLKIYAASIISEMINRGFTYDTAGLAEYQRKMSKLPKILKKIPSVNNLFDITYHNKAFSLKKALGDLKGSCQELSIVTAISLVSQTEKWGFNPSAKKAKIQDKITSVDDLKFLESFPADTKVKLVFGDLIDSAGKPEKHVIIETTYTDPIGTKKTMVIDPALIFSASSKSAQRLTAAKFCFVKPEIYVTNLHNDYGCSFSPSAEIELKKDRPMENLYRDLYITSRIYPETPNYTYRERKV